MAVTSAGLAAAYNACPGHKPMNAGWLPVLSVSPVVATMAARDADLLWNASRAQRLRLDALSKHEKNVLEEDLELVMEVQRGLLPQTDFASGGWRTSYCYEAAGLVSGDYCDVVDGGAAGLYFMVGDVCGKGVAASFLMAHMHATFRTLIPMELPVKVMLERASCVLRATTLPMHYATLICGRAQANGTVEICNSGHPLPLLVRGNGVMAVEKSGRPFGMFSDEEFAVAEVRLNPGESLVLYSDGVSEAMDIFGAEYGSNRLRKVVGDRHAMYPSALVAACREDVVSFCRGAERTDDLTIFVLGRDAAAGPASLQ
jgi:sigma-B regulation protein RsbU (phosphoserine phosphatase)